MKKIGIKRLLLLLCLLTSVFCMTACTDTISSDKSKDSTKNMLVSYYSQYISSWAEDMVKYLDGNSDEQIKADAEAGYPLSYSTQQEYIVNYKGMNNKTIEFYNSWCKTREDLGTLVSIDDVDILVNKETGMLCNVSIQATYEKRTCSFEIVLDEDCNLNSGAINPTYTTGEKLQKAIINTLLGMGTVFIVLIFISFIISLLKHVNKIGQNKENNEKNEKTDNNTEVTAQIETVQEDETDDLELVAVITAAIAASEGTSTDGFVVRSIRKVGKQNNWK